jgi:hypothetical protein
MIGRDPVTAHRPSAVVQLHSVDRAPVEYDAPVLIANS